MLGDKSVTDSRRYGHACSHVLRRVYEPEATLPGPGVWGRETVRAVFWRSWGQEGEFLESGTRLDPGGRASPWCGIKRAGSWVPRKGVAEALTLPGSPTHPTCTWRNGSRRRAARETAGCSGAPPSPCPAPPPPLPPLPPNPHAPPARSPAQHLRPAAFRNAAGSRVCALPGAPAARGGDTWRPCAPATRRRPRRGPAARGAPDAERRASEPPAGARLLVPLPLAAAGPPAAATTSPLSPTSCPWPRAGSRPASATRGPAGARPSLTVLLRGVAAAGESRRLQQAPARLAHALVRLRRHHVPGFLQV